MAFEVRETERYYTSLSLQLGIPYTYAMFSYTHKFPQQKRRCRLAVKAGTFGAILEYGVEEKVTSQSSVSATMLVGFPLGVTCRLKLTRQKLVLVLCQEGLFQVKSNIPLPIPPLR